MGGFQTQAYYNPAPAVEGDFASTNPRATVLAGPGGMVAGDLGATVGRFAWATDEFIDADGAPAVVNNFGSGAVTGFIHREQQGLIEVYLQSATMLVPAGFPITVFDAGDFWVKNNGATQALPGQKAYATFADGTATFAATGTPTAGASVTGSIAASTGSFTGSISNNVMTISAVGSGVVVVGGTLSGTGVASGTKVISQLTGTAGGVGTYSVSIPEQTVASTTISETYGTFTAASGLTGTFHVGDVLHGTGGGGVTAGTTITALGTGTGGLGTYIVDPTQTVTSTTIDVTAINVETKWYARSSALAGELVKISSYPLG